MKRKYLLDDYFFYFEIKNKNIFDILFKEEEEEDKEEEEGTSKIPSFYLFFFNINILFVKLSFYYYY